MTPEEFEEAVGAPLTRYAHECHAASIALVKSGVFDYARVARGWCRGVMGQHSWVVLGRDVYSADVEVVDPTLWSYTEEEPYVWRGRNLAMHRPHGIGSIWDFRRLPRPVEEPIVLERVPQAAKSFLDLVGPLDAQGWMLLANGVMQGWPSSTVIGAMLDDPRLARFVPIDIAGMVTDRNPGGLYLKPRPSRA